MRNGQNNNKRMRGRSNSNNNNNNNNNRKGQNPLTRVYESNGPDVKIRGTANHIAEKYIQLARDSQSNGDPVAAENYYQHAEHYYRLIALANEQFRQTQPYFQPGQTDTRNDPFDDSDDDGQQQPSMGGEPGFVSRDQPQMRENQAYSPREPQPYVPRTDNNQRDNTQRDNTQRDNTQRDNTQRDSAPRDNAPRFNAPRDNTPREHTPREHARPPQNHQPQPDAGPELGLPSFITGGGSQPQPVVASGPDGLDGQQDRFGLHRRRRRHRSPRPDGSPQPAEGSADAPQGGTEE
jgi:hypothetical protein